MEKKIRAERLMLSSIGEDVVLDVPAEEANWTTEMPTPMAPWPEKIA